MAKSKGIILKAGESYTVKPMELYGFYNPIDKEIKFNVKMNPGHTGFENSIRIIYVLAGDGLTDKNTISKRIKHMALVVCMSDMDLPGFFTLIYPLLQFMVGVVVH